MSRFPLLGLAAGLLALSAAADDKLAPLDPAKLLGEWTVVEGTVAGDKKEPKEGGVTVAKDKITHRSGDNTFVFAYKLDPKPTPAAIDLEIVEPDDLKGNKARGIVKLVRDKLTLCYSTDEDRPKAFKSTAGDGFYLWVFQKKAGKP